MQFDHYTVTLLVLRPDAPVMDNAAADALQSEHLAHPWMVPAGALAFAHTFFPRSVDDARSTE